MTLLVAILHQTASFADQPASEATTEKSGNFGTTIFGEELLLPEGKKCRVFDITGRAVMPDRIGPGIYFIEFDGQIARKVVKTR